MAAALLGSIPVAVIYSFFVDYYVAGLTPAPSRADALLPFHRPEPGGVAGVGL